MPSAVPPRCARPSMLVTMLTVTLGRPLIAGGAYDAMASSRSRSGCGSGQSRSTRKAAMSGIGSAIVAARGEPFAPAARHTMQSRPRAVPHTIKEKRMAEGAMVEAAAAGDHDAFAVLAASRIDRLYATAT